MSRWDILSRIYHLQQNINSKCKYNPIYIKNEQNYHEFHINTIIFNIFRLLDMFEHIRTHVAKCEPMSYNVRKLGPAIGQEPIKLILP